MRHTHLALLVLSTLFISTLAIGTSSPAPIDTGRYTCRRIPGTAVRCSTQFTGACAFFTKNGCSKTLYQKYTANGCIACNDETAKFWEEGKCTGNKVYCDQDFRPQVCTREYEPVCAYSIDAKGKETKINAGNDCSACANESVNYFVRGECPKRLGSPSK